MRLELLHQDIGRDLEDDVRDEEDGQGNILLIRDQAQLLGQAHSQGIGDVDSVTPRVSHGNMEKCQRGNKLTGQGRRRSR